MADFSIKGPRFDGVFCTVDTFRHLITESDAVKHLQITAQHLKRRGFYVLGLHLLPGSGVKEKIHTWKGKRGRLTVHSRIEVLNINRKSRRETLEYTLRAGRKKYQSVYKLRTYTFQQFKKLLETAGCFEIVNVYDLDYDTNKPVLLNANTEEAVFLLRKIK